VTKPFLKVQLVGGLGNQLFQWATSTSIASKRKLNLIGDPSFLREGKSPLIELNLINEDVFSRNWIPKGIRGSEYHRKYINRLINNLVYEKEMFTYDPRLHHLKENSTIRGFFQSWRYFDDISDEIKLKLHDSFKDRCMFGENGPDFKDEQTIAIHVRRGDYAQLKDSFGLLGKNYYLKRLEIASNVFPRANVVVFDEVFGKISNDNLEMVSEFFSKIKEYFEKIFVITHNPLVTNWSDNVVRIRKEENISYVSQ